MAKIAQFKIPNEHVGISNNVDLMDVYTLYLAFKGTLKILMAI